MPMNQTKPNEAVECYLNRNRKTNKILNKLKRYQELRMKYQEWEIPYESINMLGVEQYLSLYNNTNTIKIPNYWKKGIPNKIYQPKYTIPYFYIKLNITNCRDALYSTNKKKGIVTAALHIDRDVLYNYCTGFKTGLVLDSIYDGTNSYFINRCKAGIISNELKEAIGDDKIN